MKHLQLFYSGSNYDYHFVIKELASEFDGKFEGLGEKAENCKTFFQFQQKNNIVVSMSYKIKLIASARFIVTSLENFIGNLTK